MMTTFCFITDYRLIAISITNVIPYNAVSIVPANHTLYKKHEVKTSVAALAIFLWILCNYLHKPKEKFISTGRKKNLPF